MGINRLRDWPERGVLVYELASNGSGGLRRLLSETHAAYKRGTRPEGGGWMCAKGMRLTRRELIAGALVVTGAGAVRAQSSDSELPARQEQARRELEIAGGTAPQALREFVRQTGLQVLFEFDAIRHHVTHPISGRFDPSEALALMLAGSGLGFEFVNERTVSVRPRGPIKTSEVPGR
jgi:hypothetical protein